MKGKNVKARLGMPPSTTIDLANRLVLVMQATLPDVGFSIVKENDIFVMIIEAEVKYPNSLEGLEQIYDALFQLGVNIGALMITNSTMNNMYERLGRPSEQKGGKQ